MPTSLTAPVVLFGVTIRQDAEGRFCLNDLHRAAGGEVKHRPAIWVQNQQTIDLAAACEIDGFPSIESKQGLGTFVVKELVYAYAMWISPSFHITVIRTFDSVATGHPSAPMTPGQALVEMAQNFLRHETQIAELSRKQHETAAQVMALVNGENYLTVVGWGNLTGQRFDNATASRIGKQASALCRERGHSIGSTLHPAYGRVNTYPREVLDELSATTQD